MKTLLTLLTLATGLSAQQVTLSSNKTSLHMGESGTITMSITGQATAVIAAVQFTGASARLATGTPVPAGSATGKVIPCTMPLPPATALPPTAPVTCIMYSIGSSIITNGMFLTMNFTPTQVGTATYTVSGVWAANATGNITPLAAPSAPLSITVLPAVLDLNGDGLIDITDVNRVVSQIVGNSAVTNCDVNGDMTCNVADVQLVVAAAK